ncbi:MULTISPECIES: MFS transporter [unclassified Streptomyces]|uniref:MFS transporter n=1 Tax=unclassified Streptomyces TaxID=2593676 RepID=UPI000DBA03E8|nr:MULTISPECIES: MFS transporter [unclassified Streptomyces]MYT73148.1 MFS transporter [Streptomyces sp. SID8367]RAJ73609.1 putative MFS family arabinose efflux permease [Streptomyces sp. PsTaAH-137]
MPTPPSPPSSPRPLLRRHRDFRSLWIASTTGRTGASVASVALPLTALTLLDASPFRVSLLTAAAWLPWLLIGLVAGAWVDRLPRRPLMLVCDAVSFTAIAAIPAAHWLGVLTYAQLLVTALLTGTATVFFQTSYQVLLPRLVDGEDRAAANSTLHASEEAGKLAGYSGGGALVALLGPAGAMGVQAAAFAASFASVLGLRHREQRVRRPAAGGTNLVQEIREGLAFTFRDGYIRAFVLCGAAANLALMGYQSILVAFLVREAQLTPGTVGVVMGAGGLGGIAGAFAARRLGARFGTARAVYVLTLGTPCLALLMPLAAHTPLGVALFAVGYTAVVFSVVAENTLTATFQQDYTPAALYGRSRTASAFVNYGTIPLGALLGGALAETLGLRPAMWLTVALLPLCGLILLTSPMRHDRDLPTTGPGHPAEDDAEESASASSRSSVSSSAGR